MLTKLARVAAVAMCALAASGLAAAQTPPKASPTPAPTPVAFSAHAHVTATMAAQNGPMTGTAQLAVAQRANFTRIDVLSLKSDTLPLPPISATVVIDRSANTITAWSDTTKLYRVQPFLPRPAASATPNPTATSRPAVRGTSPFSKLDVFELTLKLIGHTTTLGLPTTGMSFDMQLRNKGQQATTHVSATTQLADEYAMFPMTLDVSAEPGGGPFNAKISYAVDDLTRGLPELTRFAVPAGYTEASSLMGVLFPGLARPFAVPTKAP